MRLRLTGERKVVKHGFGCAKIIAEGTPEDLPPARRDQNDQSGHKSKVPVKKLKAGIAAGAASKVSIKPGQTQTG